MAKIVPESEEACQSWQDKNFRKIKKFSAGGDYFSSFNPHCYADPHQLKI